MDKNIEKIIEANEKIITKLNESLPIIIKSLTKSSKFKYTSKSLLSFIPKIGYLNSAILDMYNSKNIYSAAVLYRSILDHNFRHLYIYTKALKDNNDNTGRDYCITLKASEDLQWFNKINNHNNKFSTNKTKWNTKSEHNKSIKKTAEEFKFGKIIEYLKNNNSNENLDLKKNMNEYLLQRSTEYGDLSAIVHGGPSSDSDLNKLIKDKRLLNDKLLLFVTDSFNLYKSLIETTYLFAYLMNEENEKYWRDINNIEI